MRRVENIWEIWQILPNRPPEAPVTFKGYAKLGHRKLVLFDINISASFEWIHGNPVTTKYEFSEKADKSEAIFVLFSSLPSQK